MSQAGIPWRQTRTPHWQLVPSPQAGLTQGPSGGPCCCALGCCGCAPAPGRAQPLCPGRTGRGQDERGPGIAAGPHTCLPHSDTLGPGSRPRTPPRLYNLLVSRLLGGSADPDHGERAGSSHPGEREGVRPGRGCPGGSPAEGSLPGDRHDKTTIVTKAWEGLRPGGLAPQRHGWGWPLQASGLEREGNPEAGRQREPLWPQGPQLVRLPSRVVSKRRGQRAGEGVPSLGGCLLPAPLLSRDAWPVSRMPSGVHPLAALQGFHGDPGPPAPSPTNVSPFQCSRPRAGSRASSLMSVWFLLPLVPEPCHQSLIPHVTLCSNGRVVSVSRSPRVTDTGPFLSFTLRAVLGSQPLRTRARSSSQPGFEAAPSCPSRLAKS